MSFRRALGIALLSAGLAGVTGCEKVVDSVDEIRRSTERNWERGRKLPFPRNALAGGIRR